MKKLTRILTAVVLVVLTLALLSGCTKELTDKQLWEKLDGHWFRTLDNGATYERDYTRFYVEGTQLLIENANYPTSWVEYGPLTKFESLGDNVYKLTFSYPGFEGNDMDDPVAPYEFSLTINVAQNLLNVTDINGSVARQGSYKHLGTTLVEAASAAGFDG